MFLRFHSGGLATEVFHDLSLRQACTCSWAGPQRTEPHSVLRLSCCFLLKPFLSQNGIINSVNELFSLYSDTVLVKEIWVIFNGNGFS